MAGSEQTVELQAPSLGGRLTGVVDETTGIAQFRGIPFASVSKRWTHSTTRHSLGGPVFDATKYGPRAIQPERTPVNAGSTPDPETVDDEFKCLNLNIVAPAESIVPGAKKLPVMVWIHGGAFLYGANSASRFHPGRFVALAREFGNAVIVVSINYRLGGFGTALSTDLEADAAEEAKARGGSGDTPPAVGNFALIDQKNAFEWVNEHIGDFGGDPANITAFGVSAGSISLHMHLIAGTGHQLFDRAILMSGSAPNTAPLPRAVYQRQWDAALARAGVDTGTTTARGRVAQLRQLSAEALLALFSSSAAPSPVADGVLLPGSWKFADEVPRSRCKNIVLGDTHAEGIIFAGAAHKIAPATFHALAQKMLPPDVHAAVCRDFGFVAPGADAGTPPQPAGAFAQALMRLAGAVLFNYPTVGIAEASAASPHWADHVFLYHWEEPSPFAGATQGLAHHGLCAFLLFANELDHVPAATRAVSLAAIRHWTAFAQGGQQPPWEAYSRARRFLRLGPEGETGLYTFETDTTRDYGFQPLLEKHLPEVTKFVYALLASA